MIFVQSEGTAARRRAWFYLVDATDGITPETGEAGGQPQVSKNGGAWANTSATLTAVGNGAYYTELTATELDTAGKIFLRYKSANTAEFSMVADVVALNIFDSVRAGLTALPNVASGSAGALPTTGTGANQISVSSGTVTVGTNNDKTGYGLSTLESRNQHSGTAQAGGATSITLAAGASATNDLYKGATVKVYSGTGAGQTRIITAYNGTTKVATVSRAWATNPDNTSLYAVIALSVPALNASLEVTAAAVNGNVTGSVASVTGAVGSVTGSVGSVTGNVGGNVTGSVGSVASGGISSGSFASGAINAAAVATDAIGAAELAADAVAEIAAAILATPANLLATDATGRVTVGTNADKTDYQLTAQESGFAHTGTAQAGGATSITLAAGASATNDLYKGAYVKVYSGTGQGQTRVISAYNGTTKVATVSRAWATNPDNTSLYAVLTNDSAALNSSLEPAASAVNGNVTGSVASVTGSVGGNVTGSVGSVASGGITSGSFAAGAINAAAVATDAIGASELAADAVAEIADAIWDEARSGHTAAGSFGEAGQVVRSGTAQAGAGGTITLDAGASATNDFYTSAYVHLVAGTGAGQTRFISGYVGSTKVATVNGNWQTAPDNTSQFIIFPFATIPTVTIVNTINTGGITSGSFAAGAINAAAVATDAIGAAELAADAVAEIADAVWDEARSGHTTGGSFGEGVGSVQGNVTGSVGSVATNGISAASLAADAGQELADALLDRDMSTGTDSGSSTVRTVRQALRALRNKFDFSGNTRTVYKEDDSTASWTSVVTTDSGAEPITADDPAGP